MATLGNQVKYANLTSEFFTGDGLTTTFTTSYSIASPASILVLIEGVKQLSNTYAVAGKDIIFSEAPETGMIIETINLVTIGTLNTIADGTVTTLKIADSNVTTSKIADNAVTNSKFADNTITSAKLADNNVTLAKLADKTFSQEQMAVAASVSGNVLTVTINPTYLDFRNVVLTSGIPVTRNISAPISMTVSNGSTLGMTSAVASRLVILAIDNAGTVEVAITNLSGWTSLDEMSLITTTAEGGAGAADSASVMYSTTARTNVAYRVMGYVDITQATAGTWASQPSAVKGMGGQPILPVVPSFGVGQSWQNVTGSRAANTTYTNTTGKVIHVFAVFASSGQNTSATFAPVINGVGFNASTSSCNNAIANVPSPISLVVPAGHTYRINTGGAAAFQSWAELI